MLMRLLYIVQWKAEDILITSFSEKGRIQRDPSFYFFRSNPEYFKNENQYAAHLNFNLKLSAIIAMNSELVGFPLVFWIV